MLTARMRRGILEDRRIPHASGLCPSPRDGALLVLLGLSTLSGCSPYVYKQEITAFSGGVDAVVSSYQSGRQAIDTIAVQQRQAADAAARTRLLLLPGCDQIDPDGNPPGLPDCAIVAFSAKSVSTPTSAQRTLADAAPAFDALKAYAGALTAVTESADEAALNQATQTLTTAAGGLASAAAKLRPAAAHAGAAVAPVGGLIGDAIAVYLDQRRLVALHRTVPVADAVVQALGQVAQGALIDIRAQQLLLLGRELRADARPLEIPTVGKLGAAEYEAKLAALQTEIAVFNRVRGGDPAAAVAGMVNAHRELALALRSDAGQQAAVETAVQTFVDAAEKLRVADGTVPKTLAKAPAVHRK